MPMVMSSITWLCRSCGSKAMRYLADWVRGTVRMYTESATRNRTATLKAVTGRSASTVIEADRPDDRGGRRRRHVGQPGRRGELAQERGERLDVHRAARDPDPHLRSPDRVRSAPGDRQG